LPTSVEKEKDFSLAESSSLDGIAVPVQEEIRPAEPDIGSAPAHLLYWFEPLFDDGKVPEGFALFDNKVDEQDN
jgi:hypothetical protein